MQVGSNSINEAYNRLSIDSRTADQDKENTLGKDDFLQLMLAQMQNQDPLSPQENGEFIVQMAQFSSLEGIQNLNETLTNMATSFRSSQALQASSLVGRTVQTDSPAALLGQEGTLSGTVEVPQIMSGLEVKVYDQAGGLVAELDVSAFKSADGFYPPGEMVIEWDGMTAEGERASPGVYTIKAEGQINGEAYALGTYMNANVDSVTLGQNGDISLNLAGVGTVPLAEVKRFF